MNKITISTGHPDAGLVYAEAYEAVLVREAALREELNSAQQLANMWKEQERLRCVQLSDASKELDAAFRRVCLANEESTEHLSVVVDQRAKIDELQQRLTIAEQRAGELEELLRDCANEFSTSEASQFEMEMLNKILAAEGKK